MWLNWLDESFDLHEGVYLYIISCQLLCVTHISYYYYIQLFLLCTQLEPKSERATCRREELKGRDPCTELSKSLPWSNLLLIHNGIDCTGR